MGCAAGGRGALAFGGAVLAVWGVVGANSRIQSIAKVLFVSHSIARSLARSLAS